MNIFVPGLLLPNIVESPWPAGLTGIGAATEALGGTGTEVGCGIVIFLPRSGSGAISAKGPALAVCPAGARGGCGGLGWGAIMFLTDAATAVMVVCEADL